KNAVNAAGSARVYYACGGPMEVPYQCVMTLPKAKRAQVTVISHSPWNNKHKHGKSRTWKQLIKTGVKNIGIGNQNKTAFNSAKGSWSWLNSKGGKYAWLYKRNKKKTFDASDAGMCWFIITGRGDKKANMTNIKKLFNGQLKSSDEKVVETVEPTFSVNVYPNPAVDVVNVAFEGTAPVTIFNIQGKVVYQNNEAIDGIELNKDMIGESGVYFIKVKDVTKQLIIK
ncbi:MAG: T9SS type A sorting domain-containing protein, partial [Bacteroidales bacterium]|nr:T9SS type A sorting domain-containing protein [Bacteroidales bacterium]